jgi:puromycin-sensitive aminopeptidase
VFICSFVRFFLWCVFLGEFDVISNLCCEGKLIVSVFTMIGESCKARFALQSAVKCIEYLTEYTHIPIPLPKMDLLLVPTYPIGGMVCKRCVCVHICV